jgi:hypothetical protein
MRPAKNVPNKSSVILNIFPIIRVGKYHDISSRNPNAVRDATVHGRIVEEIPTGSSCELSMLT